MYLWPRSVYFLVSDALVRAYRDHMYFFMIYISLDYIVLVFIVCTESVMLAAATSVVVMGGRWM